MITCHCEEIRRLDGDEAARYAGEHLRLIERGVIPLGRGLSMRSDTQQMRAGLPAAALGGGPARVAHS